MHIRRLVVLVLIFVSVQACGVSTSSTTTLPTTTSSSTTPSTTTETAAAPTATTPTTEATLSESEACTLHLIVLLAISQVVDDTVDTLRGGGADELLLAADTIRGAGADLSKLSDPPQELKEFTRLFTLALDRYTEGFELASRGERENDEQKKIDALTLVDEGIAFMNAATDENLTCN